MERQNRNYSYNINPTHQKGNRKLMVVIDEMDESEKILKWINEYNSFIWMVVFSEADLSDSHLDWLNKNFQLALKVGAEKIFCMKINDLSALLKIASANNVTHIICSKSIRRKLQVYLFIKEFLKRLSSPNNQLDEYWFIGNGNQSQDSTGITGHN
jgi:K+-sensing histidine kinase KdpD